MGKFKLAFLALVAVSGVASAATQGTLDATSTGTFTNTFNSNPAQVQILNLLDSVVGPSSVNVTSFWGTSFPGAENKFCVVNTGSGAVKLVLTPSNAVSDSTAFVAKEPGGGTHLYANTIWSTNGAATAENLTTTGFTVPAADVVTAAANCGAGNVSKSIVNAGGAALPVGTLVYTDTITIVASPV